MAAINAAGSPQRGEGKERGSFTPALRCGENLRERGDVSGAKKSPFPMVLALAFAPRMFAKGKLRSFALRNVRAQLKFYQA